MTSFKDVKKKLGDSVDIAYKKAYNNPGKVGAVVGTAIHVILCAAVLGSYFTNKISMPHMIAGLVAAALIGLSVGLTTGLALDRKQLQENSHNYQSKPLDDMIENINNKIAGLEKKLDGEEKEKLSNEFQKIKDQLNIFANQKSNKIKKDIGTHKAKIEEEINHLKTEIDTQLNDLFDEIEKLSKLPSSKLAPDGASRGETRVFDDVGSSLIE